MRKVMLLLAFFGFLGLQAFSQRTITGTVTDAETGLTIPGVSVIVKGTNIGTVTDIDGKYMLKNVPDDATTLVFSMVGMKTTEVPITGNVVDCAMEKAEVAISDVVVTALGISRERKALGYATQTLANEDLIRAGTSNIINSLTGKVAGLEIRQSSGMPGAPAQIFIRGARSFTGNNAPLYVVDGMPIASDADYGSNVTGSAHSIRALDIDPNDIESITVLKGQAGSALYGLRAANGVIVITTKRGSQTKNKPTVSITSNYTMDVVARLPEVQQTYAQGYNNSFIVANSLSWGPRIDTLWKIPVYGGLSYKNHATIQVDTLLFFDPYKGEWVKPQPYNNPKNFYNKPGHTLSTNVVLANTTELGNYSISIGNVTQRGIIPSSFMDRYTARAAGDFNFAKRWKTGFVANVTDLHIGKLPSGNDSWLFTVYGAPASFDLAGTPWHMDGTDGLYRQISYRRGAVGNNPYWVIHHNRYEEKLKRFFGNTYLSYKPVEWIVIKYQLGFDTYTNDNYIYREAGTGVLPAANAYKTPTKDYYDYVAPTGGEIQNYGVTRRILNSLLTISLNKQITDKINLGLLIGNEIDDNRYEAYSAIGRTFIQPGWRNMQNTTSQESGYSYGARRTAGIFGNLSLDLYNMLFLNVTGRGDRVSSMPRNNRTFFYPSASLSFLFSELLKDQKILSYGKARVSYAEVGQAANVYKSTETYVKGGVSSGFLSWGLIYPLGGVTGFEPYEVLYDPNLKPENTQSYEAGIELRFFNNRIGIDYAYFNQNTKGQIFGVPLAGSTGYATMVMNAGHMQSKGHELTVMFNPIRTKAFDWEFNVNFTKIINKVIELHKDVDNIALGGYVTPNIRAAVGYSYPAIFGETFLRDSLGRPLVDDDPNSPTYGMPLIGEFGKIGEVTPDFFMSFTNTFKFFQFISLTAQIDFKKGGQIYSGSNRLIDLYGASKRTETRDKEFKVDDILGMKFYKSDGTPNDIMRGGPNDPLAMQVLFYDVLSDISEAYVYETSYLNIREISLNIELPRRVISPLKLQRVSLSFISRGILLWTTLPNFHPETSQGQGNMQGGLDYMSLPHATSYGVGLNITF